MRYKHPTSDYTETTKFAFLWCLLIGSLYFILKESYKHAAISFILAVVTSGVSWIIYPFFAKGIMHTHYMRKGYTEVRDDN